MRENTPERWGSVSIGLHWTIAALVLLVQVPAGITMTSVEPGTVQNVGYNIHKTTGIVIFLLVWGTLIWSLVKYRARRGGTADQIRGNTPLEIGWTVGAASILVVLTVVTFLYLDDIENPPASGPNGLTAAQARTRLEDAGLTVHVDGPGHGDARVVAQGTPAGTLLPEGAHVRIAVD